VGKCYIYRDKYRYKIGGDFRYNKSQWANGGFYTDALVTVKVYTFCSILIIILILWS